MPEHLKALVVILACAAIVFRFAERPLSEIVAPEDFRRRRNVWIAITLIAFLSHSFWLYIFAASGVLLYFAGRDRNPLALYALLLFAVPPFDEPVPGFGLINYFFYINHVRLLNLMILLPFAVRLMHDRDPRSDHLRLPDWLMAAYLVYVFAQQAMVYNATGTMRAAFYLLVDAWLPYYVVSRSLRSLASVREFVASFVVAVALMAPVAVFEAAKSWLLYDGLRIALGLPPPELGVYIRRGEGALRANVSVGNSIVLGYVMMTALSLFVAIAAATRPRTSRLMAIGTLTAGLLAALSRGPWVGMAGALLVSSSIGPGAGRRIARLLVIAGLASAVVLMSPLGDTVIDHLPFVGTVDEGSVTYRQRLFEVSMLVFWQSPLFGSFDYINNPLMEEMRQGQGIIDIVNSYLAVSLAHGVVGLVLFVGPFLTVLVACWRTHRRTGHLDPGSEAVGRAVLACMIGILVTIATVSSISVVPTIYWMVLGLGVAYARGFSAPRVVSDAAAAVRGRPKRVSGHAPT